MNHRLVALLVLIGTLQSPLVVRATAEERACRGGGRWAYLLGAVPAGTVGAFHAGTAFTFGLCDDSQNPAPGRGRGLLIGVELDYSRGRGETREVTREREHGASTETITGKNNSFAFLSTGLVIGFYIPARMSIYRTGLFT